MLSHAKLAAQGEQRNWETLKAGKRGNPILFTADFADVTQRMPIRFRLSYAFFALLAVKSEFQPQRTHGTQRIPISAIPACRRAGLPAACLR
jgi:hypothetical protein